MLRSGTRMAALTGFNARHQNVSRALRLRCRVAAFTFRRVMRLMIEPGLWHIVFRHGDWLDREVQACRIGRGYDLMAFIARATL